MIKSKLSLPLLEAALDKANRELAPLEGKSQKDGVRMMFEEPDEWKKLFRRVYRLKLLRLLILIKRDAYLLRTTEKPEGNKYLQ